MFLKKLGMHMNLCLLLLESTPSPFLTFNWQKRVLLIKARLNGQLMILFRGLNWWARDGVATMRPSRFHGNIARGSFIRRSGLPLSSLSNCAAFRENCEKKLCRLVQKVSKETKWIDYCIWNRIHHVSLLSQACGGSHWDHQEGDPWCWLRGQICGQKVSLFASYFLYILFYLYIFVYSTFLYTCILVG